MQHAQMDGEPLLDSAGMGEVETAFAGFVWLADVRK
jgi:hypothetical protein